MTDNTPFFVVGSERSGTTMFRLMLNQHSRLCIPRESWFLTDLMDQLPLTGQLSDEQQSQAFQIIKSHDRWPDWDISDEILRSTLDKLNRPTLNELVDSVFTLASMGKERWGDKTPPYVREIPRLHALFPKAKFIHVIRDGRDVVLSLQQKRWFGKNRRKLIEYWSSAVLEGHKAGQLLPTDQYMEVHYEDLVLNAEETLVRAMDFLGEDYEPTMLDFYKNAERNIAPWEKDLHSKTMRRPAASDVCRWKKELAPVQIAFFEAIAGNAMDRVKVPRYFVGISRIYSILFVILIFLADNTLPLRRKLGIHFSLIRKKL